MSDFVLTIGADADLTEIAAYTNDTWGVEQAAKYGDTLNRHFHDLAAGEARTKAALPGRADLRVSRCEHHYVFSSSRGARTVILAVLHERMDLLTRLRARLDSDSSEFVPDGDEA